MCRDLASENSDLYELETALCDNGKLEEFLLFVQNFKMTLRGFRKTFYQREATVSSYDIIWKSATSYLYFFYQVGSTTAKYLHRVILGLGTYFSP